MAITNSVVKKVFDDLDSYRDFCRFEGSGRVFDERALYNSRDYNWQAYERHVGNTTSTYKPKGKKNFKR
jgi:hypothetical protein